MEYEQRRWTTFSILCLTVIFKTVADGQDIKIGGVFPNRMSQEHAALFQTLHKYNNQSKSAIPRSNLHVTLDVRNVDLTDSFNLGVSLCGVFESGAYLVVGISSSTSLPTIKAYSNKFHIPYITPSLSGTGMLSHETDFQLYLRPSPIPVLVELIHRERWDSFHYVYDDMEGLYRLEHLLELANTETLGINPLHIRKSPEISAFFRKIVASEIRNVVLDTSTFERTKLVLTKALKFDPIATSDYHFIVLDFDLKHIIFDSSSYDRMKITGLAMVNENNSKYKELMTYWSELKKKKYPNNNIDYLTFQAALTHDVVEVIAETFRLVRENRTDVSTNVLKCDHHSTPWSNGRSFLNVLKRVDVNGLTGRLQFDDLGRRKNYFLDIIKLTRDLETEKPRFDKIGTWDSSSPETFAIGKDGSIVEPADNFLNKTLIISTIEAKPYYMLKKDADLYEDEQDKYEGYCVDLMEKIAAEMNISYKFRLVADSQYGRMDANGRWNGMVGELIYEQADMVVAPLTITSERERFVEFSTPFMNLGISILIKKPVNNKPGVFSFLHPLSHEIWMCIVFSYVGVSVVLFLVSRFSPYEWHTVDAPPPLFGDSGDRQEMANDFGIFNSLWFSLGAFMQQGCDISPRSLSGRIVGGVWWFFTLIIISSYTANLAAFLTVNRMISPIESADDLSKQTEISYGSVKSGSTREFFKTSNVETYQKMWAFMSQAEPTVFVDTVQNGIDRVRSSKGQYAFLLESTMNDYISQQQPCDTIKVGDNLNSRGYGIAMRRGYPLKQDFTLAILKLREDSILHGLEQTWWFDKGECGPPDAKSKDSANALSLNNVAGVFYILVGGLGLAMLVALMEFCYKSRKEARKAKTSLSIAMRGKARMSIKGGDNVNVSTEFKKSLSTVPITRANNSRKSHHKMLHIDGLDSCNGTNAHTQV
ncbi:glutamate receptor 4-like isoform X2 [Glandiceps talaboti]